MFEGQGVFQGARQIKYMFKKSKNPCNSMVVIFSGFQSKGNPPPYNYVKTLEEIDTNKLFVIDDANTEHESKVTYYLGERRDNSVEVSVVSLITKIANEQGIHSNNITLAGTSKGGYAALYFGIKYGYGCCVVGGPQTLLGSYLIDQRVKEDESTLDVARFIAGGVDDESRQYLNDILFKAAREAKRFPILHIHVGKGDHHLPRHVQPFINELDKLGVEYILDIGEYSNHSYLGEYFPKYLIEKLTSE
nr:accessory Sec system protein Asp2 [Paenibacillus xylanexedens]